MRYLIITMFLLSLCDLFAQEAGMQDPAGRADELIHDYKFEQALVVLQQVHDTTDFRFLGRIGYCHFRLGNYDEAIAAYERIRSLDSTNLEALYNLGQLYSHRDQYDLSKRCVEKLMELDSTNSFYYKQYAELSVKTNDPVSAIAYYHQTIRLNPRDMEAYGQLSSILIDAEQYSFVDSMLTGVLHTSENARLRLLLARAKLGQDKYEEVIQNVNRILQTNDTTATCARLMGISNFLLDRYDQVIPWMEFLVGRGLKADWVYYYLGVAYQKENNLEFAIRYLNLAIEESISDHIGTYYTQLASAYEEVKDFKNAIRNYRIAYETSKADILLYHLARNYDVYYKDKTQAQRYYQKYLESDDTVKLARTYSKYRLDELLDARK